MSSTSSDPLALDEARASATRMYVESPYLVLSERKDIAPKAAKKSITDCPRRLTLQAIRSVVPHLVKVIRPLFRQTKLAKHIDASAATHSPLHQRSKRTLPR